MTHQSNIVKKLRPSQVRTREAKDWKMIVEYMTNRDKDIQLNKAQQDKLDRYQYIYNQFISSKSERVVIDIIIKKYEVNESIARKYVLSTQELFGHCIKLDKTFELNVQLQIAKNLQRKCEEVQDFKTAAGFQKNATNILRLLKDENLSPGENYEGIHIEAVFDPTLIGGDPVTKKDFDELVALINKNRTKKIDPKFYEAIDFEMNDTKKPLKS